VSDLRTATPTGNTYDKYNATNPIERRLVRRFLGALDRMLDGLTPTRVLEVGTGEGQILTHVRQRFPDVPVLGLDLPDRSLADDWRQAGLPGMFADTTRLPLPDGAFDLVLAIEVLEHVAGPRAALDELARVCAGTLVASVPCEPIWRLGNIARGRYVRQLGNTPGHVNHWTSRGFRRFVAARFEVDLLAIPLPWTIVRALANP
jgi:SAM-dependent methyltransferase